VGKLCKEWAEKLGLSEDVIVAGGAFDCHMGAVGAGVAPNTLVRVIGTSTCDVMVSSYEEVGDKLIKGICGQVDGSVIPGMIGLEAGQSSFGDVFAMFRRVLEFPLRQVLPKSSLAEKLSEQEMESLIEEAADKIIVELTEEAEKIPIGESSMVATDWINGRRTPDANQLLEGTIAGFTLGTQAPQIYRALVEATAYGTKAIVDRFISEGCRIDQVIGIGGIALKSPFVMQSLADIMQKPIKIVASDQACALGAAMFGAVASGYYSNIAEAVDNMNSGFDAGYMPIQENVTAYNKKYASYLKAAQAVEFFTR
jgi:L-ribulokinase